MSTIRVRIAPSPTGIPHIGNTRTAFFNFLFARHNKGKFILRIEDTDQKRIVPGAQKAIVEILDWLGLKPDETYIQSERLDFYKEAAQNLRLRGFVREEDGAIRFIVPKGRVIEWVDAVGNKKISFKSDVVEDFIILKSDGFPTYHLASVVDDHLIKISHVIRGDEWISSTPKHLLLYEAFDWKPPVFAHLPVILGPDKTKLSKRHGAKSILEYRDEGFLKEALLNFMALLGWNPGADEGAREKEIFSMEELIELFDLTDVNTSPPIFDIKKLEWMNGIYIRKTQNSRQRRGSPKAANLKSQIYEFYEKKYSESVVEKTIPLIQDRIKKLSDYLPLCEFFFREPEKYEIDVSSKKDLIRKIIKVVEQIDNWEGEIIGSRLQQLAKKTGMKTSDFFMVLRVAVTGRKVSPPLAESMALLGKEKVLARLIRIIK